MKRNSSIAYLRQLCCSGLDIELVIPEFLRAVSAVIPSNNNTFTGFTKQMIPAYFMVGFAAPDLDESTATVITEFFSVDARHRLTHWFRQSPVLTETSLFQQSFYMSDMYNLVCRPFEQHHSLHGSIMRQGWPIGMLNLFRPSNQKPFNNLEQGFMKTLLPYLDHALNTPKEVDIQYADDGPTGMMVMDTQGAILYLSQGAKQLLALASHPLLTVNMRSYEKALLAQLAQLCRNLNAIFQNQAAAPPSWSHINKRGRFLFRAYWLNRQNNESSGLVGMTIEHQEPIKLKILSALHTLPLSPVQKEVAALIAQGFSSEQIGRHLHIKLTTVKDHIRKIFIKLDIQQREALLPKLLAMQRTNTFYNH